MYLGIDYGTKNIGLAVSEMGIAIPFDVVTEDELFSKLPDIIASKNIQTIVVGVAIGYDAYGKQYQVFQSFIEKVRKALPEGIEVVEQDEDLSTFEAQAALEKEWEKDHVDDVAASIILQRYLDRQEG